jgi:hypothetical protein
MSYKLRKGQIAILELLYTYRFGSRELLAKSLGIRSGSSLYEKLEVLFRQGYIGKWYDSKKFRWQGLPVAYYLLPKGVQTLQELPEHDFIKSQATRVSYRNQSVGLEFIIDTLKIYELTQDLQATYPGLKVFTQADMRRYSYFPKQLPDALLSLPSEDSQQPTRFFLDYIPARKPNFAVIKQIISYAEFFEDGGWDTVSPVPPAILLVVGQGKTEKYLQQLIPNKLFRLGVADMRTYTTTLNALAQKPFETKIWTDIEEPEELVDLVGA